MFDHVYKQQQKRFYNANMHGVNWDTMSAAYRKFLPHINNNYDFAELLSEWLGELNVSHTGGRFSAEVHLLHGITSQDKQGFSIFVHIHRSPSGIHFMKQFGLFFTEIHFP